MDFSTVRLKNDSKQLHLQLRTYKSKMSYLKFLLTFLIFLVKANFGVAQLFSTNNVNIAVTNGTQLTVQGDFQNDNGATITNNGIIDLSGNWIHNAANNCFGLGVSTGTVILNGANQFIGGLNSTTFNNLTLIGSGIKTLQQDITVGGASAPTGVLSLGDRNLDLNSKTLTISNPLPLGISRTSGFIVSETAPAPGYGSIKWNIGNAATGNNYVFPFGNVVSNSYLPFNFNITTAGAGAGYVKLATYPTNTAPNPNNRPLPTGLTMLVNNSSIDNSDKVVDRYFIFDVNGYLTMPVSTMVFPYRDTEWSTGTNSIIESNLRLQRLNNGTAWIQPPFGTVNTTSNTVTATSQNNYSAIWTIVDLSSPLPISLLYFNAILNANKQTDLLWTTAYENNSANFEVERSIDALNFETIETVPSHHYSNTNIDYHTLDPNPKSGINYYRLKHNDYNGDFTYSQTVAVRLTTYGTVTLNAFPNPFTDYVIIQILSANDLKPETKLTVTNLLGQVIMEVKLTDIATDKNGFYILNRGPLTAGLYNLSIYDNESRIMSQRIAVQ
jgi:hypothetical protein